MSEQKYPRKCVKYGHDHSGTSRIGEIWTTHTEQCKNFSWWPFGRCTHIETFEEACADQIDAEPPTPNDGIVRGGRYWTPMGIAPGDEPSPREVHVYHYYPAKKTKAKK